MSQTRLLFTPCESLVSATHLTRVSTMVGHTQLQQTQSLEEAVSSPMASRRQLLLTCPPNSGGHISLCPRDTPQCEKHLSPLVPLASPRKLVSDILDFFSYLPLSRDQQHSTSSFPYCSFGSSPNAAPEHLFSIAICSSQGT